LQVILSQAAATILLSTTASTPCCKRIFTMKTMMALILAASFAVPAIAAAQTSQTNPNFSQGKQAPVLSDGASTGYNSNSQR